MTTYEFDDLWTARILLGSCPQVQKKKEKIKPPCCAKASAVCSS